MVFGFFFMTKQKRQSINDELHSQPPSQHNAHVPRNLASPQLASYSRRFRAERLPRQLYRLHPRYYKQLTSYLITVGSCVTTNVTLESLQQAWRNRIEKRHQQGSAILEPPLIHRPGLPIGVVARR
jgi:hypothetical protein